MGGLRNGALAVMAEQVTGRGARGVVAAAAPLAAALGAEAMRAGGNAYDGAVTAALAETVLLPPKCGLGGDLVALRLRAGASAPEALVAIGPAAAALQGAARRIGSLPQTGALSVGPPAAPAGYAALAAHARAPLARLVEPAVALARDGFPWAAVCSWLAAEALALVEEHQPGGSVYLPGGRPPAPGELVRLPGLARALEELARLGPDVLQGPLGEAIVARVQEAGGVVDADDLRAVRAEWVPAAEADVAGWRIWATPAPTHGPALLDAVSSAGGASDPPAVWEAFRAATERRRRSLGDQVDGGTSMVSAADADGDVVVVIHSNSFPQFGSGLVVPDFDLILNNRAGRGFTATAGHPNAPVPGRRPATTLHAWAAGPLPGGDPSDGGASVRPQMLGGTPGGANQVSWNAQALAQVLTGVTDPGMLVASPRWEWQPASDALLVEEGFPAGVLEALDRAAPGGARPSPMWGLRSAQQVVRVPVPGEAIWAAADPRTVGAVVAV